MTDGTRTPDAVVSAIALKKEEKRMKICYRDEIGLVVLEVDMNRTTGVGFDGENAYFTDTEGNDYKIKAKDIVLIGNVEE